MKYIAPIGQVKRNLDGEVLTLSGEKINDITSKPISNKEEIEEMALSLFTFIIHSIDENKKDEYCVILDYPPYYSHLLHSYFRAYGMKVAYTIGTNDLVIF